MIENNGKMTSEKHVNESTLEQLATNPDRLAGEITVEVREHMSKCTYCRETLEFLQSFYDDFKGLDYAANPRLGTLVNTLFPPAGITYLHPFRYEPKATATGSRYTTLLAAMTNEALHQRFITVATLVSEEHDTLVRIMHDKKENVYRLYLSSAAAAKSKFAVVSLIELDVELIANEHGQVQFNLPGNRLPVEWSTIHAVVRVPVLTQTVEPKMLSQGSEASPVLIDSPVEGCSLKLFVADDHLHFAVISEAPDSQPISRVFVQGTSGTGTLVGLDGGKGMCRWDSDLFSGAVTFRLYS